MRRNSLLILIVIFLIITVTPNSFAQDQITGAFGKKLGAIFNPKSAIGTASLNDGTPMYQFNPSKKFRFFDKYYVMITPKTHKIYSIWGIGTVENTEIGKKEQAVLMAILQKKYGKPQKEGLFESLMDAKIIDHGNRYIIVKVSGLTDVTIDIRYYDRKLSQLAEKERIELEANKLNSSGL